MLTNTEEITRPPQAASTKPARLLSVDALRGFDMIWILGAEGLFSALFIFSGWTFFENLDLQFKHSQWHGFTFYDLIFPLFIFLSGVTLGIAPEKIKKTSCHKRTTRYQKAFFRLGIMFLLGIFYNHGWGQGIPFEPDALRYSSVLLRIGIAWFFCAMIVWHFELKYQLVFAICILLFYWLLQMFIPSPFGLTGVLTIEGSWNAWVDIYLLPGARYQGLATDPEGLLSHLPAVVNALAGAFAGRFLVCSDFAPVKRAMILISCGIFSVLLASLWSVILPFNKSLWTSSFSLVTIGWSLIFYGVFYWLFDVKSYRKIGYFFAVIGVNSITLYLLTSFFNWGYFSSSLFGGIIDVQPDNLQPLFSVIFVVLLQWLLAYFLYIKKIFINI